MCNDTATPQLEELVTTVANQLMTVDAATSAEVSQRVLAYLVEQLGVDVSFLRHNDRDRRATRLVAEWPPRLNIPDPDPLRLIYFADADPVFALCEHAKEPLVFRPEPATEDYQRLIEEARGVPVTSLPPCRWYLARSPLDCWGSSSSVIGNGTRPSLTPS